MKVLFIYFEMGIQVYNPLSIGYLSAVLKSRNHQVSLIRVNRAKQLQGVIRAVKILRPDIIAFTTISNFAHLIERFSSAIKDAYNAPIIAGGIHATVEPEEVLNYKGVDFICLGEGEEALLELVTKLERKEDISAINNIWIKRQGTIIKNPLRDPADLDSLPSPDIDIFYDHPKQVKRLTIMTQRGCPFNCAYCCNEYLNKLYEKKGNVIRKQSLTKVMDEIEVFVKKYPNLKWIHFEDDVFILDKKRVKEFCLLYQSKFKIPFSINARCELIDIDTAKRLKQAGCVRICIGVEAGDEHFRKQHLNRRVSNETILKGFDIFKKVGIATRGYIVYGFPFETEEHMRRSFDLLRKINPSDGSQVSVFYPYPKTSLYEASKGLGLLTKSKKLSFSGGNTSLNFDVRKKKLIKHYYELTEGFHHRSNNDIVFLKKFYPYLLIPYMLLRLMIPPKLIWRFMYKTKTQYFKKAFTVKPGWPLDSRSVENSPIN